MDTSDARGGSAQERLAARTRLHAAGTAMLAARRRHGAYDARTLTARLEVAEALAAAGMAPEAQAEATAAAADIARVLPAEHPAQAKARCLLTLLAPPQAA